MRRSFLGLMLLAMLLAPVAAAAQPLPDQTPPPGGPPAATTPRPDQQPPPPPQGQTPKAAVATAPPRPIPPGQPVNVKVEFAITDQFQSAAPVQKTVSLMLADRENGMVRSEGFVPGFGNVQLHVDAEVAILPEGKILTRIGLSYDLINPKAIPSESEAQMQKTQIRESLRTILENGKPVVISQSADPVTDRKVTVEVKATIVK